MRALPPAANQRSHRSLDRRGPGAPASRRSPRLAKRLVSTLRSPQILQEDARRLTPTRTTTSFASSTCVLASPPRTVPRLRPVQLHVRAPRQTSVRRYDLRNGPILGSRQPSRFHWHPRQRLAHGRRRHRLLLLRGICPQRMTSSTDRSTHRVAVSTALSSGATRAGARRPLYRTRLARD
jgi:hypothetical protein